jgi:PAS domain S-box-containing protein
MTFQAFLIAQPGKLIETLNKSPTSLKSGFLLAFLIAAGFLGNYFAIPLFFGADFLFGSIAVLLVLYFYGLRWGMFAAVIAHGYTYFLWGHPYGFINFVSEALFVGILLKKGRQNLVGLDGLFWLCVGMPLVYIEHGVIMQMGAISTVFIMLKQAINGVFNVLLVSLAICYLPVAEHFRHPQLTHKITLRDSIFNLLVMMVLFPALLLTMLESNRAKERLEAGAIAELQSLSANVQFHLRSWHQNHLNAVEELARTASRSTMTPSAQLQRDTEVLKRSFPDFRTMHVENTEGRSIAFYPEMNDKGEPTLGLDFSARPWFQEIKAKRQSLVSEIFVGSIAVFSPIVNLAVPIVRANHWLGAATGTLDLKRVQKILQPYRSNTGAILTLTDARNRVIASTSPERPPLQIWDRRKTGASEPVNDLMYLWHPDDRKLPSMTRWKQSYYVQETLMEPELPWKLIVEAPVAPLQSILYAIYVRNLAVMACLTTLALLLSLMVSGNLTRPLAKLAEVTANLPEKLSGAQDIDWPASSAREVDLLIGNSKSMAMALEENFRKLQAQSDELRQANRGLAQEVLDRQQAEEALRQSEEEAKELARENAIIAEIGRIIGSTLDIEKVYELFSEEVHKLIPFDRIAISVIDFDRQMGVSTYIAGMKVSDRWAGIPYPLEGTGLAEMIRTQKSVLLQTEDIAEVQDRFPLLVSTFEAGFRSIMNVPLYAKGQIIGALLLRSLQPNAYTLRDLNLVERVGTQIAGAIANSQLYAEQRKTEEALRQSEVQLRVILESTADGILAVDDKGKVIKTNQRFADIWKIPSSVLDTGDDATLLHFVLDQLTDPDAFINKVTSLYGTVEFDSDTIFFKDGRVFERYSAPLVREGAVIGRVWSFRDITERKQAEGALRDSEERYRSLVANTTDMIFIAQDGLIKFPNPAATSITGYPESELVSLPFIELIHPDDREMVMDKHRRRLNGEDAANTYSFRFFNKRKEELWAQLNAVLITWDGRPGVLCSLRDITPQKKLEAQYLHAQKMEAVGILAGGVAHDFNNLLQAVLGHAEMLLIERKEDDSSYRPLTAIQQAAQRGAELTRQLLTFSRKVHSSPKPLNLNQEIVQVEKILQRTIPKMIQVELRLAGDLWTINADPVQVGQVIMNLAVNARDAMAEGGELVIGTQNRMLDEDFCRRHVGSKPGRHVLFSVSDTGQGMNKEVMDHLFEPFFTTKGVGQGTGLGLAIVYGIVKGHDGYIECGSELDKGTIFKIYWPAIGQGEKEELEQRKEGIGGTETILLVDDEAPLRDLAKTILSTFGYTILTASDGERALEVYRTEKERIDLIILDLIMPGMGGMRCLEELLRIHPDAKVLIATGYYPEDSSKTDVERQAKGLIRKPYNMNDLLLAVRNAIDK